MEPLSSLQAYVEAQDRLDREAREMFPYDFSTCSVEQGYVKQQVFACQTCMMSNNDQKAGGVCYGCSITCHGEHDLVELFNRRAFKCDCGSPIMGDACCNITKTTRPLNSENIYNDNFRNIFCYCKAEYDPQKEEGVMFQCLLCEDWFHDRCIAQGETLPDEDTFEHYICRNCVRSESWLQSYQSLSKATQMPASIAQEHRIEPPSKKCRLSSPSITESDPGKKLNKSEYRAEIVDLSQSSVKDESSDKVLFSDDEVCKWSQLPQADSGTVSLFLPEDFRDHLCHCKLCGPRLSRYPALVSDEEVYDPPEDDGDNESTYDAGSRAMDATLQSMPRDKAIEGLLAYNKLKDHITACLKPLAEKGEIITSEHVRGFFEQRR